MRRTASDPAYYFSYELERNSPGPFVILSGPAPSLLPRRQISEESPPVRHTDSSLFSRRELSPSANPLRVTGGEAPIAWANAP